MRTKVRSPKSRAKKLGERRFAGGPRTRTRSGAHLILSRGEENTGGRERRVTLADTFESLPCAIFWTVL